MANFKIGQRVRVIANHTGHKSGYRAIGREGVITDMDYWIGARHWDVEVELDGDDPNYSFDLLYSEIVPLTDPRAEEFIADMERFARVTKREPVGV